MATIRILLAIVCFLVIGSSWRADRSAIDHGCPDQRPHFGRFSKADEARKKILAIAEKEVGVQEYHENSGPRVDQYNAYVGFKSVPWCASFVSWCHGQAGYLQPKTAWSPALFPRNRLAKDPVAGMVLGIYFASLKRIGHCGFVTQVKGDWICSVEGNTSATGGREGNWSVSPPSA